MGIHDEINSLEVIEFMILHGKHDTRWTTAD